ncbi:glutamate-5-semialdehyde dehydrogenase [Anaerolinea sp.]|uniref:glutamate-5-semialdehyde dehydrogenase n=1 Tax=Anaerolinea sp. TaxID=1872519 RepID=UPI002ACE08E8|nr:glutamate-5-semialdehyde dehydrogenase [Anaerolinea sp.]
MNLHEMGKQARWAGRKLASVASEQRTEALSILSEKLLEHAEEILEGNGQDVQRARELGLSEAMLDRLLLNPSRLQGMSDDLRRVAHLPDPLEEIFEERVLPNGLRLHKRRVPLGVLGVIYESRPNVTVDVAGLAIKSGNAVILRGGSETIESNRALIRVIHQALMEAGLPENCVQWIDDSDRKYVYELLQLDEFVDLIIPRGGASLHEFCRKNSRIPVITGGIGICHLFVEESADLEKSLPVILNAKVQRPTVCNALDTLLVQRSIADIFLPEVVRLLGDAGVSFKVDEIAWDILKDFQGIRISLAQPEDFDTEWLSLILGIRVVNDLEEAIEHIAQHSTGHSDGILTQNKVLAEKFVQRVDSAAVYVNASTRFTDGGQFGLGAEVAISTQRIHARGPMGLRELTTYKWVVEGMYHVRS